MADKQWYFNSVTEQAELGPISPISQRMGPYTTREEALKAWEIVEKRNKAWNKADREWDAPTDDSDDGSKAE